MKIYLDDNRADKRLANLLVTAGHSVVTPGPIGLRSASDACHLEYAIRNELTTLTNDRDDFRELHQLILTAGGRHPGILVVRFERDSSKAMKPRHILAAIENLGKANFVCANEFIVLNRWR